MSGIYEFVNIILHQHINCNTYREHGDKNLQSLHRNFPCQTASKPYADAVGDNDQYQKAQDICPGNSGKISDTCRNCNKYGIKKCHADCDPCRYTAGYQKGHYKNRAVCTGKRADRSGCDSKEDQKSHMVCESFPTV